MVKKRAYVPHRGDVVWLDFNPPRGHEQAKKRPALILSSKSYNQKTNLALVCPITSQEKGYPFEVKIQGKTISGVILSDQVRCVDWHAREAKFIEKTSSNVCAEVQDKIIVLLVE